MLSSNSRSLLRVVLAVLVVQVFAFSSLPVFASQTEPQAKIKKTKKNKKRRKERSLGWWLPTIQTSQSSTVTSIGEPVEPAFAAPVPRRTVRVTTIPPVHVSPVKVIKPNAPTTTSFSNTNSIEISATNAGSEPEPAVPYSSDIDVIGLDGLVTGVSVTLNGLTHDSPDDLDMLLVGPSGQAFHFWSDVGGSNPVDGITVTVADTGLTPLPDSAQLVDNTTYRPFNADSVGDDFPVPAIGPPYNEPANVGAATFTSVYGGLTALQANGTWRLFITDDTDGNGGSITRGWTLHIETNIPTPAAGQLIISEFRLSGPGGDDDEFIELYNTTGKRLTVQSKDDSTGLAVVSSDGVTHCVVPNGTQIPAAGHFLCAHASNTLVIAPDATYNNGIAENVGIALFNNASGGNLYTPDNLLDAVGSTSEMNTTYKEGNGYPPVSASGANYTFYRDLRPAGLPKDSNDNGADFMFVESTGANVLDGQALGAPGAENLSSPTQQNGNFAVTLIAPCEAPSVTPNRARDLTSDPGNNSTFGTLSIRRKVTNITANDVTQLRFRIIDITTFPAPEAIADLRARTSTDSVVNDPCKIDSSIQLLGVTLEGVSTMAGQPLGGGFNSTLVLQLGSPLGTGSSVDVDFLLGVQQTGHFRFFINVEALP